jgi:two-component system, NarL family, sensor kinase
MPISTILIFLQQQTGGSDTSWILVTGTIVVMSFVVAIIVFLVLYQRKMHRYNVKLRALEEEKKQILLTASIKFQEEERQRIAADLHDDAGPLLATIRLYLNENLIHQDPASQLQSIYNAKRIIDDTIRLIRNISHSMMPPTLKNFGLESAANDLFQKMTASGSIYASARFHDYKRRLNVEQEGLVFRIIQELVNNILKHSNAGFIHLTQNSNENFMFFRLNHDGQGLTHTEFIRLNQSSKGLGLKNIATRTEILRGRIIFELDSSGTYYKITLEVPKDYTPSGNNLMGLLQ